MCYNKFWMVSCYMCQQYIVMRARVCTEPDYTKPCPNPHNTLRGDIETPVERERQCPFCLHSSGPGKSCKPCEKEPGNAQLLKNCKKFQKELHTIWKANGAFMNGGKYEVQNVEKTGEQALPRGEERWEWEPWIAKTS